MRRAAAATILGVAIGPLTGCGSVGGDARDDDARHLDRDALVQSCMTFWSSSEVNRITHRLGSRMMRDVDAELSAARPRNLSLIEPSDDAYFVSLLDAAGDNVITCVVRAPGGPETYRVVEEPQEFLDNLYAS